MRGRSLTALALLLFGLTEAASQASDETYADVLFVRATETEASVWRFDVTVSHADTGWDNHANRWLVFASGSNQMLGERVLLHPHVAEQPFTRSLSGITIARHITRVTVAARTNVTQFGGRQIVLDLLQGGGERFEIVRQAAKPDVEVTPRWIERGAVAPAVRHGHTPRPSTRKMIGIGLDFGTTNTTVAVAIGNDITYLTIDNMSDPPTVMPTALYIRRDMDHVVGSGAITGYLSDNAGRVVRLRKIDLGQITMSVNTTENSGMPGASEGDAVEVSVKVRGDDDADQPGRLFRGLKSYLGVRGHERFRVFDRQFRTVALVTLILADIRRAIEASNHGDGPISVRVGRPVHFVGDDDANQIAIGRLHEACENAGFTNFSFYPEPVAASLSYMQSHSVARIDAANGSSSARAERLLTFDFGGGTLDLCLLENDGGRFKVLATDGLPLGGNRIDQLIIQKLIFPELGEGSQIKSAAHLAEPDTVFPFYRYADYLLNWQMAYMMNQPSMMDTLFAGIRSGEEQQQKLGRLWHLIRGNHAYSLLNATEQAKSNLSLRSEAAIDIPEIDLRVTLDRSSLASILRPVVTEIEGVVGSLLASAGVSADQIDRVVCTGGSSQLLPVQARLEEIFPGRIVRFDYYRSIAGGLAIASANDYHHPLD